MEGGPSRPYGPQVTVTGPSATANAHHVSTHPDVAAIVILILTVVFVVVIGLLWFHEEERRSDHLPVTTGARDLRQMLALGESVWWGEFEREFAAYVASHRGRDPDR
jgi:hypothetical protein